MNVNRIAIGAAVLALGASLAVYPWLPNPMPTHFDIHGDANGWSSRAAGAFVLPAIMIALAFFRQRAVTSLLASFFLALHVLVLRAALGNGNIGDVVWVIIGLMFVGLGLVLPRVRRNRYVGIRTPWSMSSDEAWARTHRAASRVMVVGGVVLAIGASVLAVRVLALAVLVIVPIAQSWWIARKLGTS